MINVTKTFLPSRAQLDKYIDKIYQSNWLTNFGPLEQELTTKLKNFLAVENLLLVSNGTLALQVLYRALGLEGEVITSPFSFVATTSSLAWEKLTPVFADIDEKTFNLNSNLIEAKITQKTSAILPIHVFGRACDVSAIQTIADKHHLKVIYDAAHAFNVRDRQGQSILNYGDASILSLHATKLFHTIEGGAIITHDKELIKECKKLINFGFIGYDAIDGVGINAKMNEFSAAMGLAVLENIDVIMSERGRVYETYNRHLKPELLPSVMTNASPNYSYYPILLKDETTLFKVRDHLLVNEIMPRRYFYPSLNTLKYLQQQSCPVSENIASRILCLPMYPDLTEEQIKKISHYVNLYS